MINGIEETDLELERANIPIFGGSMADFRETHSGRYVIADDFFTNTTFHFVSNLSKHTKIELLERGYDGIVNANLRRFLLLFGYYTGVPIKRIRNDNGAGFFNHSLPFNELQF